MEKKVHKQRRDIIPKNVSDRLDRINNLEHNISLRQNELNTLIDTYNAVDSISQAYIQVKVRPLLDDPDFARRILRRGLEADIADKEAEIAGQVKMLTSVVENK